MGFWKRTKQETVPGPVTIWLIEKKRNVKEWWVRQMVKLAAKLSLKQQKVVFVMLCIICCAYSTFLIIQGFTVSIGKKAIPVNSISTPDSPKPVVKKGEDDKNEIARIKHLLSVMDSLRNDPHGRYRYDSILRHRPGLLDTLRTLEEYYKTE